MNNLPSSNPAIDDKVIKQISEYFSSGLRKPESIKSGFFFFLLIIFHAGSMGFMWIYYSSEYYSTWIPLIWGAIASIIAIMVYFVILLKPYLASYFSIFYSICQGIVIGGLMGYISLYLTPSAIPSAILNICGLIVALIAWKSGLRKEITPRGMILISFFGGLLVFYFFSVLMRLSGNNLPMIHETSAAGVILCLVFLALTTLNVYQVLEFTWKIEKIDSKGAYTPYCAFACQTVLFWIYIDTLIMLFSSIRKQDPRLLRRKKNN